MKKQSIFKIGDKKIGAKNMFFVIEEGQASLGDYDKTTSMIDAASMVGADAIEFQFARANDFYVKHDPCFKECLEREYSNIQIKDMIGYAKSKGLEFVAAPFSRKLVELLSQVGCSGFNINASDLTNPDIIDAVIDSGLPFFLSLPLANEKEIDWAVNRMAKKNARDFAFMHGQHTMASGETGVAVEHTSLGYIDILKERYHVPVGYIDHTPFTWMPAAAVSAGADVVSKHLALSRELRGPDWHICLEPGEMTEAVTLAKKMRESIKTISKKLAPGEYLDRAEMRRSIVSARKIDAGERIKRNDIEFKRPGTGMDPSNYKQVLGKIANRSIKADEQIKLSDLRGGIT